MNNKKLIKQWRNFYFCVFENNNLLIMRNMVINLPDLKREISFDYILIYWCLWNVINLQKFVVKNLFWYRNFRDRSFQILW